MKISAFFPQKIFISENRDIVDQQWNEGRRELSQKRSLWMYSVELMRKWGIRRIFEQFSLKNLFIKAAAATYGAVTYGSKILPPFSHRQADLDKDIFMLWLISAPLSLDHAFYYHFTDVCGKSSMSRCVDVTHVLIKSSTKAPTATLMMTMGGRKWGKKEVELKMSQSNRNWFLEWGIRRRRCETF